MRVIGLLELYIGHFQILFAGIVLNRGLIILQGNRPAGCELAAMLRDCSVIGTADA